MSRSLLKKLTNQRLGALLLLTLLTTMTAWATTTSTINVGGTDYTLFTGFTATAGTNASAAAYNYPKLVDGNLDGSSSWHLNNDAQPYYIEFNADNPIIPKGYIFNTYSAYNFKPTSWVLRAKANIGDDWTELDNLSGQSISVQEYSHSCNNEGNNAYKYFRFEVSNTSNNIWLTEIRLYGSSSDVYYTHLTKKDATCTETGIKQDCYLRNDGKYFTDETGETELAESDVIDPIKPHTGEHHEATDVNIEYWQCSMCSKYFSNVDCTTEITEEETKIYRTITIDGSISELVTSNVNQALAGATVTLTVSHLIDASTLKVNNGAVELTDIGSNHYTFTVPADNVTVTAETLSTYSFSLPDNMEMVSATNEADGNGKYISGTVITFAPSLRYSASNVSDGTNTLEPDANGVYTVTIDNANINITATVVGSSTLYLARATSDFTAADGETLVGSTSHTVTIANGANITLNNATITGGIVCSGTATITLVGTNIVNVNDASLAHEKAGIQIGGSGTTLTIRGSGSLTATGGTYSAGIGLGRTWDASVTAGAIVIEGGTVNASGDIGIGIGTVGNSQTATIDGISIKGGTVNASLGKGDIYYGSTATVGYIKIYDTIDMVDASKITETVTYMHVDGEIATDVTASKTDYFTIGEDGNRRLIVQKPVIAEIAEQAYTGSEITPEPTVTIGSIILTKGTDYTYSYTDNTNVGTATVRATFQGTYASLGYVEKTFSICRNIYIADAIAHGKVSADSYLVDKDGIVTLTIIPDNGYSIGTVKYNDGTEDHVIMPTNNVYSFNMPASDVTVSATFNPLSGYCGWSSVNNGEDVTWKVTDTDGNGTYETLTISGKGKIDSYSADGQPWVAYKSEITTAVIEEGVTYIGTKMLYQYPVLTSVSIASSVMTIGTSAFYGCSNLTTVNGASGVTEAGSFNIFESTAWLNNLPNGLTTIGHVAYCFKGDDTSVKLDAATTQIAEGCFVYSKITSITIPASVTSIRDHAFFYSALKKIYFLSITPPQSVGSHAFENCNPTVVVPADAYGYYITAITSLNNNNFKKGYTITCGTDVTATSSDNGPLVAKDETVTLSYGGTIPEGYTLKYVVKDASGNDVAVSENSGVYSFTMPESNVTVSTKWATTISMKVENAEYMVAGKDANVVVTMTPDDFNGIATISVTPDGGMTKTYNVAVVDGVGRYVVNNLANKTYNITASFDGDDNYTASTSDEISLYVPKITTGLDISLDRETINVGEKATVSITLNQTGHTNAEGDPTLLETPKVLHMNAIVHMLVNSHNSEGPVAAIKDGQGSFDLIGLAEGTYKIDVAYAGDDKYVQSQTKEENKTLTLTVVKNPTTVGVEVDAPVIAKEQVLE